MTEQHDPAQAPLAAPGRRRFLKTVAGAAAAAGMATFGTTHHAFASSFNTLTSTASNVLQRPDSSMVLGHDISTLQQLESVGRTFSDNRDVHPAERILAHHGATYIRERLWVNPPMPFNDLPHILSMAKRIKAAGLKFLLDFHYSDFWADPGKQPTPASWQGQDLPTLANTVYHYTRDVLEQLARQ